MPTDSVIFTVLLALVAMVALPVAVAALARVLFGPPAEPPDKDGPTGGFPVVTDEQDDR